MKTVLLAVAALGLSVSGAAAECVGHTKTTASVAQQTKAASVDQQTKVASVANTPTTAETPILKKEEAKKSK